MSTRPQHSSAHDLPLRDEIWRKLLHLLALLVPLGMALAGRSLSLMVLVPLTVLALTADALRTRSVAFGRFIRHIFGNLMRPDEWTATRVIQINGATWVLVTATLLAIILPFAFAIPAFVTFMISDAAAAIVGRVAGRHRWPGTSRTVEGSVAFAVTASVILLLFPSVGLWPGVAAVTCGTIAEALPGPLNDNIRVPIAVATVLWLSSFIA